MYSGGYAYYGVALDEARFKPWHRGSSFFSLVNTHWKILGLDSAWEDHALVEPQPDWIRDELKGAGRRKTMLLSHHQLFSAYEKVDDELPAAAAPILAQHPVTSWFWGHEHRCVLYSAHQNVGFPRCLGNGGIPVYMSHNETDPYVPPATYEYRRFIQNGLERWALFGFAVLDFDGPKIDVRYIDEDGATYKTETIAAERARPKAGASGATEVALPGRAARLRRRGAGVQAEAVGQGQAAVPARGVASWSARGESPPISEAHSGATEGEVEGCSRQAKPPA